jgi:hypothetical protein
LCETHAIYRHRLFANVQGLFTEVLAKMFLCVSFCFTTKKRAFEKQPKNSQKSTLANA